MIRELKDERKILRRCQKGDLRALEIIYRHYQQPLHRFALRMLGCNEDAEDALQMTFLRLYGKISQFQFNSKFSSYLFRILINICYDLIEKKKRNGLQQADCVELFYQPANDLQMQLEEAIGSLPERMRECFILFAIEGFKQNEIAEILNLSIGTVKAHIFKAKEKLRFLLSDALPESSNRSAEEHG